MLLACILLIIPCVLIMSVLVVLNFSDKVIFNSWQERYLTVWENQLGWKCKASFSVNFSNHHNCSQTRVHAQALNRFHYFRHLDSISWPLTMTPTYWHLAILAVSVDNNNNNNNNNGQTDWSLIFTPCTCAWGNSYNALYNGYICMYMYMDMYIISEF